MPSAPNNHQSLCWTCGYSLQALTSTRCPECGRPFNPADPKTTNTSGHHRRLPHWFATHALGSPTIIATALAVFAMALTTRLPAAGSFDWSFLDVQYLGDPRYWPMFVLYPESRTWLDLLFICALSGAALIISATSFRVLCRAVLKRRYRPVWVRTTWRTRLLLPGLWLLFGALLLIGGQYRLAQHLIAPLAALPSPEPQTKLEIDWGMTTEQRLRVLRTGLILLPLPRQRLVAAKGLVELHPGAALPALLEALPRERDAGVRPTLLRLIALYRDVRSADLLAAALDDPEAPTRAAAADALGILHRPTFRIPLEHMDFGEVNINDIDPPIWLNDLIRLPSREVRTSDEHIGDALIDLPPQYRTRLEHMMLTGPTSSEREAAARALVAWPPPDLKLRVDEWGVWLNDKADLKLMQAVLDEIPPFVHRTGNKEREFRDRVNQFMVVTKPIVHISANRPLAVDLEIHIHFGRPWFAYPLPDDFDFEPTVTSGVGGTDVTTRPGLLDPLDPPASFGRLDTLRTGYPWISPSHVVRGTHAGWGNPGNGILELGLHWQSLIVTPELPPQSTLPELAKDKKYAWWPRLRQVGSNYLTSRGETERFLYYDGPTLAKVPLQVTLNAERLNFSTPPEPLASSVGYQDPDPLSRAENEAHHFRPTSSLPSPRQGLFVRVRGGKALAKRVPPECLLSPKSPVDDPHAAEDNEATPREFRPGEDASFTDAGTLLRTMLQESGLTAPEAEGLIASWQSHFFQTDGSRFLLLLSSHDYDTLCPLAIRPTPTQLVRVGIVLTEFQIPSK